MADELSRRLEVLRKLRAVSRAGNRQPAGDVALPDAAPVSKPPGSATESEPANHPAAAPLRARGWSMIAPLVAQRRLTAQIPFVDDLCPPIHPEHSPITDTVFFDTETTGLSGGAGTTVFLVGTGRFISPDSRTRSRGDIRRAGFEVTQTLLLDFPGEPEYLAAVARQLSAAAWVSYNGRAFDQRLLESRFLFAGLQPPWAPHLDLLYWSRRLWKRLLPACSLSDVEEAYLGVLREGDIPGFEIPERYFSFLRGADVSLLDDVIDHHRQDIISLALLLGVVQRIICAEEQRIPYDRLQLGRHLVRVGDPRGCELLRAVLDSGSEVDSERAGLQLARSLRRDGEYARAVEIWQPLYERGSVDAGIALAKYYEHQRRDFRGALVIVEALLPRCSDRVAEALEHRKQRLLRLLLDRQRAGVERRVL